ncbi:hypothetical protein K402DRAFT_174682 [Aulographum hederae CBS 113979]|uniref:Uncharacterized protein n=1 Tax=Aulographum hederae CBS 113979 TaxID=1176131 RepID=A0A6G1HDY5_9PEZI|nr:hypothetical protein K402DRAFT_174682 [Aulographum hederae CBS 113979]
MLLVFGGTWGWGYGGTGGAEESGPREKDTRWMVVVVVVAVVVAVMQGWSGHRTSPCSPILLLCFCAAARSEPWSSSKSQHGQAQNLWQVLGPRDAMPKPCLRSWFPSWVAESLAAGRHAILFRPLRDRIMDDGTLINSRTPQPPDFLFCVGLRPLESLEVLYRPVGPTYRLGRSPLHSPLLSHPVPSSLPRRFSYCQLFLPSRPKERLRPNPRSTGYSTLVGSPSPNKLSTRCGPLADGPSLQPEGSQDLSTPQELSLVSTYNCDRSALSSLFTVDAGRDKKAETRKQNKVAGRAKTQP